MDKTTPVYEESTPGYEPSSQREGKVARAIEKQTAKLPSDLFLWAAVGAMVASAMMQLLQPKRMTRLGMPTRTGQLSLFVGQWAPTLLLLGIYNKIVKVAGSDRNSF
jgi:hypothetical protein